MRDGNEMGKTRPTAYSAELGAGWDFDEDITTAGVAINLDTSTLITSSTEPRNKYYCRGFHNPTATAITIKYTTIGQSDSTLKTAYILAGGIYYAHVNIATIGLGTSTTLLKLYWKDRSVVNGIISKIV